ncbi:MAG: DNA polymerase III subunit chi [Burkholderiaceae bacterium]|nr:DNA polymerase III subunit chi [Burkholderiaceae bacterium]
MTRVDFHFNAPGKLQYGTRLVRKIYRAGHKAVVYGQPAAIAELDRMLWTFSALEFIPHVAAGHELAARTPVLLASEVCDTPHADVLVNLGATTPAFFSRFERLIEVVDANDEERTSARERWRFYKDRGYAVQGHDLGGA